MRRRSRPPPRLPPRGTPESAKIEKWRRQEIKAKQKEELADIMSGGKGSASSSSASGVRFERPIFACHFQGFSIFCFRLDGSGFHRRLFRS
jgi:hypothetical protein